MYSVKNTISSTRNSKLKQWEKEKDKIKIDHFPKRRDKIIKTPSLFLRLRNKKILN